MVSLPCDKTLPFSTMIKGIAGARQGACLRALEECYSPGMELSRWCHAGPRGARSPSPLNDTNSSTRSGRTYPSSSLGGFGRCSACATRLRRLTQGIWVASLDARTPYERRLLHRQFLNWASQPGVVLEFGTSAELSETRQPPAHGTVLPYCILRKRH